MPQRKEYDEMSRAEQLEYVHGLAKALVKRIEDIEGWERVWETDIKLFGVIPIGKKIKRETYRAVNE